MAAHTEVQELLGAYALDALDGAEANRVELHLRECPRCRAEVAEHREVAALLSHGGGDAPEGVWDRIAAEIESSELTPPELRLPAGVIPMERPSPPSRRTTGVRVLAGLAAAAVLAIVAILGVALVRQGDRLDTVEQRATLDGVARSVLSDPNNHHLELASQDGAVSVNAAFTDEGNGFLLTDGLPELASDRTYQLWGHVDGQVVSLGTFDSDQGTVPFSVSPDAEALMVTDEVSPGVPQSANQPVVIGEV